MCKQQGSDYISNKIKSYTAPRPTALLLLTLWAFPLKIQLKVDSNNKQQSKQKTSDAQFVSSNWNQQNHFSDCELLCYKHSNTAIQTSCLSTITSIHLWMDGALTFSEQINRTHGKLMLSQKNQTWNNQYLYLYFTVQLNSICVSRATMLEEIKCKYDNYNEIYY